DLASWADSADLNNPLAAFPGNLERRGKLHVSSGNFFALRLGRSLEFIAKAMLPEPFAEPSYRHELCLSPLPQHRAPMGSGREIGRLPRLRLQHPGRRQRHDRLAARRSPETVGQV